MTNNEDRLPPPPLKDEHDGENALPLAYRDASFLESPFGRPLRILAEYLHPLKHLREHRVYDTIVFFGSARIRDTGPMSEYYAAARALAKRVTEWSDALPDEARRFMVCTGGGPGIMEAANRGAKDAGGRSIGLNIRLPMEQAPNEYITHGLSFQFRYFFMRKYWFAYPAKALVVFPGGFGTFDELFEILTLAQTQKIKKDILIVLYGKEFWSSVVNLPMLAKHGLISPEDLHLFKVVDDPETAFQILRDDLTRLYHEKQPTTEEEVPEIPKSAT